MFSKSVLSYNSAVNGQILMKLCMVVHHIKKKVYSGLEVKVTGTFLPESIPGYNFGASDQIVMKFGMAVFSYVKTVCPMQK